MKKIDLRSDTVTLPTQGMLDAMFSAEAGDDVFGEDPTVNRLEQKAAGMFAMEAGLFCPSGTMTNQVAIRTHVNPGDEVICDATAHIYNYEGGGIAANAGASVRLIHGSRGKITPEKVLENINPGDYHYPVTRLVSIENTSNKGGGSYYTLDEMRAISGICRDHYLKLHLDGARIFNALAAMGSQPDELGGMFDSISVCLSKGLGAPMGSLLIGNKEFVAKARRIRKLMGGGMRQAGYMAAAGIYALDKHVKRLADDHRRAKEIGSVLKELPFVEELIPIDTNIIIFKIVDDFALENFINLLKQKNVLVVSVGQRKVRMVTHLDIDDDMVQRVGDVLKSL